eukprot:5780264-Heterocapsa_arctica.AAC.1
MVVVEIVCAAGLFVGHNESMCLPPQWKQGRIHQPSVAVGLAGGVDVLGIDVDVFVLPLSLP